MHDQVEKISTYTRSWLMRLYPEAGVILMVKWLRPVSNVVLLPSASYPDVSLLMKMCAQRKAGRRQHLPSVPFPWFLAVHHQSLVSRSPLPCKKRTAWGGGCYCRAKLARLQQDISTTWFQTSNLIHTMTVEWNGCYQKQNTKIKKRFSKLLNVF